MGKTNEQVGAEFVLELIDTLDADERAAFDAIRGFVETVDNALPGGGKEGAPRRRVEIVDAALRMIEQLLGVSNDAARRMTESVSRALPEIERNVKAGAKKATGKKTPAKKAPAKKAPAKKAPAKRTAKKAGSKKGPAKRS
jgi:hypothetical protein